MLKTQSFLSSIALAALVSAMPLSGAAAQDTDAALARLKALVEEQGASIDWESVNESGDTVELVGVTVGAPDAGSVPIGNVTLSGISEVDTGYRVETIDMETYTVGDDTGTLLLDGIQMTGVILPDEENVDGYGGFLFYETADLASAVVTVEGTEVFTLTDMHFEVTAPENGDPMTFTGSAENFSIDLSVIDDPNQTAVLRALGYEQLSGFFELAGSWQPEDGQLTMSQYDLSVADAGTLGITVDIAGYTPDFIRSIRELQQNMAANPDQDSSAQGLAMLGLMQQLSFHGAAIGFTDDGLTNKAIGYIAEQQGVQPSDIANQAKAVLPFALAQLNDPELTTQVTQAVSAYLDDPQSLFIRAIPGAAVPFAMIMAEAMTAPQNLPKSLGVTVVANE
jgi:hypothetical protein